MAFSRRVPIGVKNGQGWKPLKLKFKKKTYLILVFSTSEDPQYKIPTLNDFKCDLAYSRHAYSGTTCASRNAIVSS